MTPEEARSLGERIRGATEELWRLLLQAYEGRAWGALGYSTWRAYAMAEFKLSQSRAYELLNQGWMERALREASGCGELRITEAEAKDLSRRLPEVAEEIRAAAAGQPHERARELARQVVSARRQDLVRGRSQRAAELREQRPAERRDPEAHMKLPVADLQYHRLVLHLITWLYRAMDGLSRMPPVEEVAAEIEWTPEMVTAVEEAADWLDELAVKAPPPTPYPPPRRYDEQCRRMEEWYRNLNVAEVLRTHDDGERPAEDEDEDLETG